MTDILVQFHATVEELGSFVRATIEQVPAHMTVIRFPPYRAAAIGAEALDGALCDASVLELAFTLKPPSFAAASTNFLKSHPGALCLHIGRLSDRGLEESCLSARPSSEEELKAWTKIARALKKITEAGVVAVNPTTGAEVAIRGHRYTAGAKSLYQEGIVIRPLGGSVTLRLEKSERR